MSSYHLQKKEEHERACEERIRGKQFKDAVFHAAKAAEFGFSLAENIGGEIGARYAADAEGWIDIAEKLKAQPPEASPGPASGSTGGSGRGNAGIPQDDEKNNAGSDWQVTQAPKVTFDDIAGMAEAKLAIQDMVLLPLKHPDKAKALGIKAGGGILLFGPPGNGKTLFGKAIANTLGCPYFYASGAQIRSKWHGESEQNLRKLIQEARKHPQAVIFLDEIEGLLPRRSGQSVVDNRIVTQFLAEIGGFEEHDSMLLLLGATNLPWEIDEAVFRTGRFDVKIYIPPPDRDSRLGILRKNLKPEVTDPAVVFEAWADKLEGYSGSDLVGVVNKAKQSAFRRSIEASKDTALLVTDADLEQARAQIPSSITAGALRKLKEFQEKRFG